MSDANAKIITAYSPVIQEIINALGLPKDLVKFTLTVDIHAPVTIECTVVLRECEFVHFTQKFQLREIELS